MITVSFPPAINEMPTFVGSFKKNIAVGYSLFLVFFREYAKFAYRNFIVESNQNYKMSDIGIELRRRCLATIIFHIKKCLCNNLNVFLLEQCALLRECCVISTISFLLQISMVLIMAVSCAHNQFFTKAEYASIPINT